MTEEEFLQKEYRKYDHLKRNNYKLIRIISSKDLLPFDNAIFEMIAFAKKYLDSNHSWIEFNIDEGVIKCSQYTENYPYGELRKINKKEII